MANAENREHLARRKWPAAGQHAERPYFEAANFARDFVANFQWDLYAAHQPNISRKKWPAVIVCAVSRGAGKIMPTEIKGRHILKEEVSRFRCEQGKPRRIHLPDIQRRI